MWWTIKNIKMGRKHKKTNKKKNKKVNSQKNIYQNSPKKNIESNQVNKIYKQENTGNEIYIIDKEELQMIRNNIKNYIEKEDDINEKLTNKENNELNNNDDSLYINKLYNPFSINGYLNNQNNPFVTNPKPLKIDKDNLLNKEYITEEEKIILQNKFNKELNNNKETNIKEEHNKNEDKIKNINSDINKTGALDIKLITFLNKVEIKEKKNIIIYYKSLIYGGKKFYLMTKKDTIISKLNNDITYYCTNNRTKKFSTNGKRLSICIAI